MSEHTLASGVRQRSADTACTSTSRGRRRPGHHVRAIRALRAAAVNAASPAARGVERSESIDGGEHSAMLADVMAVTLSGAKILRQIRRGTHRCTCLSSPRRSTCTTVA